jgi:cobalamin synthase
VGLPAEPGALALHPLVGLAAGALAAAVAAAVGVWSPAAADPPASWSWRRSTRRGPAAGSLRRRLLGSGDAAAVRARLEARPGPAERCSRWGARGAPGAAAVLPVPARTSALLLAPMLGAWAVVVQCYGGVPADTGRAAAALIGRARFQEFGWASVVALGVTLALGEAIGLLLVVAAAMTTLGLRVLAHRRAGGLGGKLLAATREAVETVVVVTLGLLACAPRVS